MGREAQRQKDLEERRAQRKKDLEEELEKMHNHSLPSPFLKHIEELHNDLNAYENFDADQGNSCFQRIGKKTAYGLSLLSLGSAGICIWQGVVNSSIWCGIIAGVLIFAARWACLLSEVSC